MKTCFLDVFKDEIDQFYDVFKQDQAHKVQGTQVVRKPQAVKGFIRLNGHLY